MRRIVAIIVVCLLLGVIVTVIVAWACAMLVPPADESVDRLERTDQHGVWYVARWPSGPTRMWFSRRSVSADEQTTQSSPVRPQDLLPRWSPLRKPLPSFGAAGTTIEERAVLAHGWPLHALWLEIRRGTVAPLDVVGGVETQWTWSGGSLDPAVLPRSLPLQPIWFGLLIDTVLFSTVIFILLMIWRFMKRSLRVRRRLCPACAYPMGATSTCSECGARLPGK